MVKLQTDSMFETLHHSELDINKENSKWETKNQM